MAEDQLIKMHRGENGAGVTKWVKPKDVEKNKKAGYVVVKDEPEAPKKAQKASS